MEERKNIINVINFTGHKLSAFTLDRLEQEFKNYKIVEMPIHIDLSGDVRGELIKIIEKIQPLLLGDSNVVVILPPISYVAVMLITMMHGYMGNFCWIVTLIRDKDKKAYVVKDIIDLAGLRNQVREMRTNFWNNSPLTNKGILD